MKTIQRLNVIFENKDQLTLELQEPKFYGFQKGQLFVLSYAEHHEGNYGDDEPTKGACHYMVCGTEYFPADKYDEAFAAFCMRIGFKEPWKAGPDSYRVEECLEKDPEQTTTEPLNIGRGFTKPSFAVLL